jgi:hypothetical protein
MAMLGIFTTLQTLYSPGSTFDFYAAGIDYHVDDPLSDQVSMQPETVSSSLITADHHSCFRQTKPFLGQLYFFLEAFDVSGCYVSQSWILGISYCETQLPFILAQLKCQIQHWADWFW